MAEANHKVLKVAILENHQSVIDGYRFRLQNEPDFEIVGVAEVYEDFEPLLEAHPADIALLDVRVPISRENSDPYPILQAIPRMIQAYPEMVILVISAYPEPILVQGVMESGANGFILKDDNVLLRDLPIMLRSIVSSRGIHLSPQLRQLWVRRQPRGDDYSLSPRQIEALALCAAHPNFNTADLAEQMKVASSTVRNLLSRAYVRLNVSTRAAAVKRALELGLITTPE